MSLRIFSALLLLMAATRTAEAAKPVEVSVHGTRIHVGDIVAKTQGPTAEFDLGPSPAAGASRLITRAEIAAALESSQLEVPASLPEAIRVVRTSKHLVAADLDAVVRNAVAEKPLARGVVLTAVRADHPVDVADGWTRVDVDIPRAPKREGTFQTVAIATFYVDREVIARVPVRVELGISAEGAVYDAPRGAGVTLVVRRGYIEVRAAGQTMADADVGDSVPVQLKQSGRTLRTRLVARDEALAIEDGQ